MGRDKAWLELDGQTLVERGLASLRLVCTEVAIAGGGADLERFGRVVPDRRPGCGPLGGIVAGLESTPREWNLFLAVDVPFVPTEVWQQLLAQAAPTAAMSVIARVDGQVQPLCAAYRRSALDVLRTELEAGHWKVMLAARTAGVIDFVDFAETSWFRNVNTPEEFSSLRNR